MFCYHLIVLGVVEEILGYTIFTGGFLRLLVPTLLGSIAVATGSYWGGGATRHALGSARVSAVTHRPLGPVAPTGAEHAYGDGHQDEQLNQGVIHGRATCGPARPTWRRASRLPTMRLNAEAASAPSDRKK